MQCSHMTSKRKPCPFNADRRDAQGQPVCHLHDPNGAFAKNVRAKNPRWKPRAERNQPQWHEKPRPSTRPDTPPELAARLHNIEQHLQSIDEWIIEHAEQHATQPVAPAAVNHDEACPFEPNA